MIDTIILRVHGINQQKKGALDEIRYKSKKSDFLLVPQHFDLYSKLMQFKGKSFTRTDIYNSEENSSNINSNEEQLSSKTSKVVNNHYLQNERMRFTDGDFVRDTIMKSNGKFRLSSSSPDVSFSINSSGGYVDFNLSIPKYLYMHNLGQFIPQIDSKNFKLKSGNFHDWQVQKHYLFERLMKFIKRFMDDIFTFFNVTGFEDIYKEPDWNYIEIRRIDLCFNQIFNSKEDAFMYLEHQKKIHKKSNIKYKQIDKDFETSIAFHTAKHEYFKIYHKGSEYKSVRYGDFQKHHKINKLSMDYYMRDAEKKFKENHYHNLKKPNYLFDIFNAQKSLIFKKFENDVKDINFDVKNMFTHPDGQIDQERKANVKNVFNEVYKNRLINTTFIKNEADKILRYEMSISGYSFNNIMKRYIFRKDCKIHQHYVKVFSKVKKLNQRTNSYKYTVTPQDRRDYAHLNDFFNRTSNFTLSQEPMVKYHQKKAGSDYSEELDSYSIQKAYYKVGFKTILENHDCFTFSKSFLVALVDKFKKQIDYYQINKIEPYDDLINKVKKFNSIASNKLDAYNRINNWKCFDINKVRKIHKNRLVMKASQFLTESEKRKANFVNINIANIALIFKLLTEDKMSFSQIRQHLHLSKDSFYRRKRSLESLGMQENALNIEKHFIVPIDFSKYYHNSRAIIYKQNFYFKPRFSTYG